MKTTRKIGRSSVDDVIIIVRVCDALYPDYGPPTRPTFRPRLLLYTPHLPPPVRAHSVQHMRPSNCHRRAKVAVRRRRAQCVAAFAAAAAFCAAHANHQKTSVGIGDGGGERNDCARRRFRTGTAER